MSDPIGIGDTIPDDCTLVKPIHLRLLDDPDGTLENADPGKMSSAKGKFLRASIGHEMSLEICDAAQIPGYEFGKKNTFLRLYTRHTVIRIPRNYLVASGSGQSGDINDPGNAFVPMTTCIPVALQPYLGGSYNVFSSQYFKIFNPENHTDWELWEASYIGNIPPNVFNPPITWSKLLHGAITDNQFIGLPDSMEADAVGFHITGLPGMVSFYDIIYILRTGWADLNIWAPLTDGTFDFNPESGPVYPSPCSPPYRGMPILLRP